MQRQSEEAKEQQDAKASAGQTREKTAAALSASDPLERWLPVFEKGDSGLPEDDKILHVVDGVNDRVAELAPLLRSPDRKIMRQAVYAAAALRDPKTEIIEPLANAGRLTNMLIKETRAGALPNDPDLTAGEKALAFFLKWTEAMKNAGPAAAQQYRAVLEEIEREAGDEKTGDIESIGRFARNELQNLAPPQRQ